jgi:hypothetical protein
MNQTVFKQEPSSPPAATCPMHVLSAPCAAASTGPRLMRVSEVMRECEITSPLACVLDWVQNFLAKSHPELGRKGPVCPFVPISLDIDTIWMAEITDEDPSLENISQIITGYRDLFLQTEPKSGPEMMNKAFLVVFPNLGTQGASVVDDVQYRLKRHFVAKGLMLGEFHATNQSPGLRNPEFRPLRSPIPMLAIRYMVDSDLPFLMRADYPAEERAAFLRAYLSRLAGDLSPNKFAEALDAIIEAEIEKRMNEMPPAQTSGQSAWHCPHCEHCELRNINTEGEAHESN